MNEFEYDGFDDGKPYREGKTHKELEARIKVLEAALKMAVNKGAERIKQIRILEDEIGGKNQTIDIWIDLHRRSEQKNEVLLDIARRYQKAINSKAQVKVCEENKKWLLDLMADTRKVLQEQEKYGQDIFDSMSDNSFESMFE